MSASNSTPKYVPPRSRGPKPSNGNDEEKKKKLRQQRFSNNNEQKREKPSYGFLSRGEDNRLQNSESARREYFDEILESFRDTEGEQVLSGLRKIREALLYKEADDFSKKVHLFSARVGSTLSHYQTYVPSIKYLLGEAKLLLTESERHEMATLLVLHMSHCNRNNSGAFSVYHEHFSDRSKVYGTLIAWTTRDYVRWLADYRAETDASVYAIMTLGLKRMLVHMVECFNAAYFTFSKSDFEQLLPRAMLFEGFKKEYGVAWRDEKGSLVIRERR